MCHARAVAIFSRENSVNLGLLLLRLGVGVNIALLHGLDKVRHYSQLATSITDPLGMGHRHSLMLAVAAEFVGGILVALGLAGRLAALLLAFSLGLTLFSGEAGLPWRQRESHGSLPDGEPGHPDAGLRPLGAGCRVWKRFRKGGGGAPAAKR